MDVPTQFTAWSLAGDWAWVFAGFQVRIVGGRTIYETVTASRTQQTVALSRADGLHRITRYVAADTPLELVRG